MNKFSFVNQLHVHNFSILHGTRKVFSYFITTPTLSFPSFRPPLNILISLVSGRAFSSTKKSSPWLNKLDLLCSHSAGNKKVFNSGIFINILTLCRRDVANFFFASTSKESNRTVMSSQLFCKRVSQCNIVWLSIDQHEFTNEDVWGRYQLNYFSASVVWNFYHKILFLAHLSLDCSAKNSIETIRKRNFSSH